MSYRIGLDIGIGSVGWAVIAGKGEDAFIADFGVRIFDSGENQKNRASNCQERRGFRGVRRLERRKFFRKVMLRNHFSYLHLLPPTFEDDLYACKDQDVYALKVKGLDEKLSVAELFKCLIHTCNHRGYRDFYEADDSDEDDEEGKNKTAVRAFDRLFSESGKRTISEFLISDYKAGNQIKYRNVSESGNEYLLIHRSLLEEEVRKILATQSQFYPEFTDRVIDRTVSIIFDQRDFEDGPGDPNDDARRYKGFIAEVGQCPFYKDEKRGFRPSIIADTYAVTNTLSQYHFVDLATGEEAFREDVNTGIVDYFLTNGNLTMTEVKRFLKANGIELLKSENSDDKALSKAVKFTSLAKKCIEEAGEKWEDYIAEEQFDVDHPSKLARISNVLSCYQTPRRRRDELKKLGFMSDALIRAFMGRKLSGTARTSDRYMCDAIAAFKEGEIYGNFQAMKNDEVQTAFTEKFEKLLPSHIDDPDVKKNAVVFKAINETRKIINAIIEKYGTPEKMIIEVADELGRSFDERSEIQRHQKDNEKVNDQIKEKIKELTGAKDISDVTADQMDKYKLYFQQEGKSIYSGKALGDLTEFLQDSGKKYEVDHIVPYSLILDNTLSNKALVYASENQEKRQRTPLMYLKGAERDEYLKFVHFMYTRDLKKTSKKNENLYPPVSRKKLEYLLLEDIYSFDAQEMLKQWKSRNINDTRYITKYIIGIINKYLKFERADEKNVFGINGTITSKFRRVWFVGTDWGKDDKDRSTYLNHALDAVVIANLEPAYIEIGSDAIKLQRLYRISKTADPKKSEYESYKDACISKMQHYYGFNPNYTQKLLSDVRKVPSLVPNLKEEVLVRFIDDDEEKFREQINAFYKGRVDTTKMHMPLVSHKQERKFKGAISDSNPVKIVMVDGVAHKVSRKKITEITKADVRKIYTKDTTLLSGLNAIFEGKGDKYSVEDYLKENELGRFITSKGQPVHHVSILDDKTISNFYKKQINDGNYSMLGGLKYYCVELYRNEKGELHMWGIRYVDIVRKNGKLLLKAESLPKDYAKHEMYLFTNDYLMVWNGKGEEKYKGFYTAVFNINQSMLYQKKNNEADTCSMSIGKKDSISKVEVSLLGELRGRVRCSEPLSLILANT